eukprot:513434-Pyramimonas_sp.AAC.1
MGPVDLSAAWNSRRSPPSERTSWTQALKGGNRAGWRAALRAWAPGAFGWRAGGRPSMGPFGYPLSLKRQALLKFHQSLRAPCASSIVTSPVNKRNPETEHHVPGRFWWHASVAARCARSDQDAHASACRD